MTVLFALWRFGDINISTLRLWEVNLSDVTQLRSGRTRSWTWVCLAPASAVLMRWVHQTPQLGQLGSHRSDLRQCECCNREKSLLIDAATEALPTLPFILPASSMSTHHMPDLVLGTGCQAHVGSGGPITSLRDWIHKDKKDVFFWLREPRLQVDKWACN